MNTYGQTLLNNSKLLVAIQPCAEWIPINPLTANCSIRYKPVKLFTVNVVAKGLTIWIRNKPFSQFRWTSEKVIPIENVYLYPHFDDHSRDQERQQVINCPSYLFLIPNISATKTKQGSHHKYNYKKKKKCKAILGKATVNIEKYSMLTWPNLKNIPWTQSQNLMKFSAFVCITEKWKSWKFQLFWLKGSWHMAFRNFNPFRLWGDFWTMSYIKSL